MQGKSTKKTKKMDKLQIQKIQININYQMKMKTSKRKITAKKRTSLRMTITLAT